MVDNNPTVDIVPEVSYIKHSLMRISCSEPHILFNRSMNTWNGGKGVSIHPQVLFENGFLTNFLLYGNANICCYNEVVATKSIYWKGTLWLQLSFYYIESQKLQILLQLQPHLKCSKQFFA